MLSKKLKFERKKANFKNSLSNHTFPHFHVFLTLQKVSSENLDNNFPMYQEIQNG